MASDKWSKAFEHVEPIAGKEDEQSRDRLVAFLEALTEDAKSGSLFKYGLLSIKDAKLPNGYKYDFAIRQGVPSSGAHEWGEPKPSASLTERKIRRCLYCGCAYSRRIDGKRCLYRVEHTEAVEAAK